MGRQFDEPPSSEITPENAYVNRRQFMGTAAKTAGTALAVAAPLLYLMRKAPSPDREPPAAPVTSADSLASAQGINLGPSQYDVSEKLTAFQDVTTYNNFYEFGTDKSDPAENASPLRPRPWTIAIDGEVAKPQVVDIDTMQSWFTLEQRIYRMRCVEAWSMVIPWLGFQLGDLLKRVEPTGNAKFVAFTTLLDPKQMPGEDDPVLPWPYVEGLRLDEAMNPLTLLAVGLYGKALPNQNGAPIRLVVPWKYGLKGIKSIVKITLTATQPKTTWNIASPGEYGFYGNVNPAVDHPRWSQATERRIGGGFGVVKTLPFNGYADQVASMYAGMDLRKFF